MINKKLKFIEKAKLIHGDKYDYSLVEYTESKNKVKIICSILSKVFLYLFNTSLHMCIFLLDTCVLHYF